MLIFKLLSNVGYSLRDNPLKQQKTISKQSLPQYRVKKEGCLFILQKTHLYVEGFGWCKWLIIDTTANPEKINYWRLKYNVID